MVALGSAGLVLRLLGPHRKADFTRPPVRQPEGAAHIEVEHAQAPGQILQGPDDRMLHLRRRPLPELVMTQIGQQGVGDARGELAMGFLRRRCKISGSPWYRLGLRWSLFGPLPLTPQHPLER